MNNKRLSRNNPKPTQRLALEELPTFEAVKIPLISDKGDGLGCRCSGCRHQHSYQSKPHWRTVLRERKRRAARQASPRH